MLQMHALLIPLIIGHFYEVLGVAPLSSLIMQATLQTLKVLVLFLQYKSDDACSSSRLFKG